VKPSRAAIAGLGLLAVALPFGAQDAPKAQVHDLKTFTAEMRWRAIGPFRGGRTKAITGVPGDPNVFYIGAVNGGVWKTTDGGRTFQKVLSKDENTGASDLEFDPKNPDVVYACLWEQRQGPWENGAWAGTSGGIFKSTDGGTTWRQLTKGLPGGEGDGVVQA